MRRSRFTFLPGAVIVVLFIGCSTPPANISDRPLPDRQKMLKSIAGNHQRLVNLDALGTILLDGPDFKKAFGVKVEYRSPDRYRITLTGAFGVKYGSLTLMGDEYLIESSQLPEGQRGKLATLNTEEVLGLPFKADQILAIIQPLTPSSIIPKQAELSKDLSIHKFKFDWSGGQCWIEPDAPVISRILTFDQAGDTLWFRQQEKIKRFEGVSLPLTWQLHVKKQSEHYNLTIKLINVWVNRNNSVESINIGE